MDCKLETDATSSGEPKLTLPRSTAITFLIATAIVGIHFLLCSPAATCRTNDSIGYTWLVLAPYLAYLAVLLLPLFEDRNSYLAISTTTVVAGLAIFNSLVFVNLESARPHIGHGIGMLGFLRECWLPVMFYFLPIFTITLPFLLCINYKVKAFLASRRNLCRQLSRVQFSVRSLLIVMVVVATILAFARLLQ